MVSSMKNLRIEITIEVPPDEIIRIGNIMGDIARFEEESRDLPKLTGTITVTDIALVEDEA